MADVKHRSHTGRFLTSVQRFRQKLSSSSICQRTPFSACLKCRKLGQGAGPSTLQDQGDLRTIGAGFIARPFSIRTCFGLRFGCRVDTTGWWKASSVENQECGKNGSSDSKAAASVGALEFQRLATNLLPLTLSAMDEQSHNNGFTMTIGCRRTTSPEAAFRRASFGRKLVSTAPPGRSELTVTPLPSRSFAHISVSASIAALETP